MRNFDKFYVIFLKNIVKNSKIGLFQIFFCLHINGLIYEKIKFLTYEYVKSVMQELDALWFYFYIFKNDPFIFVFIFQKVEIMI